MPQNDEQQVRTLITDWAAAIHRGQMDRVLADHADDVVMFDGPPRHDGVRGIAAYRDAWPEFFDWQTGGTSTDQARRHSRGPGQTTCVGAAARQDDFGLHPTENASCVFRLSAT